jgi:hypothetical protein
MSVGQLIRAERGNRRGPGRFWPGKPTARRAQPIGGNCMAETRTTAAESQLWNGCRRRSSMRIWGRMPDTQPPTQSEAPPAVASRQVDGAELPPHSPTFSVDRSYVPRDALKGALCRLPTPCKRPAFRALQDERELAGISTESRAFRPSRCEIRGVPAGTSVTLVLDGRGIRSTSWRSLHPALSTSIWGCDRRR